MPMPPMQISTARASGMSFSILPGELVMVCGEVGAGKSSLLMAIANETIKLSGRMDARIYVSGSAKCVCVLRHPRGQYLIRLVYEKNGINGY